MLLRLHGLAVAVLGFVMLVGSATVARAGDYDSWRDHPDFPGKIYFRVKFQQVNQFRAKDGKPANNWCVQFKHSYPTATHVQWALTEDGAGEPPHTQDWDTNAWRGDTVAPNTPKESCIHFLTTPEGGQVRAWFQLDKEPEPAGGDGSSGAGKDGAGAGKDGAGAGGGKDGTGAGKDGAGAGRDGASGGGKDSGGDSNGGGGGGGDSSSGGEDDGSGSVNTSTDGVPGSLQNWRAADGYKGMSADEINSMSAAQTQSGMALLNDPDPYGIRAAMAQPNAGAGSKGLAALFGGLMMGACAYTWFGSSDTAVEARPVCTLTFAGVGAFATVLNLGFHLANKRIRTSPHKPWFDSGSALRGPGRYGSDMLSFRMSTSYESLSLRGGDISGVGSEGAIRIFWLVLSGRFSYRWGEIDGESVSASPAAFGVSLQPFVGGLLSPYVGIQLSHVRGEMAPDAGASGGAPDLDPTQLSVGNMFMFRNLWSKWSGRRLNALSFLTNDLFLDTRYVFKGGRDLPDGFLLSLGVNFRLNSASAMAPASTAPSAIVAEKAAVAGPPAEPRATREQCDAGIIHVMELRLGAELDDAQQGLFRQDPAYAQFMLKCLKGFSTSSVQCLIQAPTFESVNSCK